MQSRFYLALVLAAMAVYAVPSLAKLLIFALYSMWVPQIWVAAAQDEWQPAFSRLYVLGTSASRLAVPVLVFGGGGGALARALGSAPSLLFAGSLAAWTLLQVLVLECQLVLGPRFFVPPGVFPAKHDYGGPLPAGLELGIECVICTEPIAADTLHADRALTPCGHIYHRECLKDWLDIKLECPSCRAQCPSCR